MDVYVGCVYVVRFPKLTGTDILHLKLRNRDDLLHFNNTLRDVYVGKTCRNVTRRTRSSVQQNIRFVVNQRMKGHTRDSTKPGLTRDFLKKIKLYTDMYEILETPFELLDYVRVIPESIKQGSKIEVETYIQPFETYMISELDSHTNGLNEQSGNSRVSIYTD